MIVHQLQSMRTCPTQLQAMTHTPCMWMLAVDAEGHVCLLTTLCDHLDLSHAHDCDNHFFVQVPPLCNRMTVMLLSLFQINALTQALTCWMDLCGCWPACQVIKLEACRHVLWHVVECCYLPPPPTPTPTPTQGIETYVQCSFLR